MPITSFFLGTTQGQLLIAIAMIITGISYWAHYHPGTVHGLLDLFNFGSPSQKSLFLGESSTSTGWVLVLVMLFFLILGDISLSWSIKEKKEYERARSEFKVDMEWNDEVAPTDTPVPTAEAKKQSATRKLQNKGTALSKSQKVSEGTNE